jgi:DNA-directed RNA polymerase specialized sigma24 family protein
MLPDTRLIVTLIAQNILRDTFRRGRVEARAPDRGSVTRWHTARTNSSGSRRWPITPTGLRLLESLPPDQREAVRARVLGERPYGEIARELRTSELVIRKRVSRGLATLRRPTGGHRMTLLPEYRARLYTAAEHRAVAEP